jgi:hypothetical protein
MPTTDPLTADHGTRHAEEPRTSLLPTMPDRVQKIAMVMAVLSFFSFAITGNVTAAVMSAALWVGGVYVVFLLVCGVRKVIRRGSQSSDGTVP